MFFPLGQTSYWSVGTRTDHFPVIYAVTGWDWFCISRDTVYTSCHTACATVVEVQIFYFFFVFKRLREN